MTDAITFVVLAARRHLDDLMGLEPLDLGYERARRFERESVFRCFFTFTALGQSSEPNQCRDIAAATLYRCENRLRH